MGATLSPVIDRPVFLIGTGRCGSTFLYRLLGYHPDLAWMSHHTAYLPGGGLWGALARVHDLPGLEDELVIRRSRLVPQPTESYRLVNQATDGVFTRPHTLSGADMTAEARERLRGMVRDHLLGQGKPRFLFKHTGFPRVRYLDAAFPDALFVHVKRDGRAVATSLCKVDWWSGEGAWGWGGLSEADQAAYEASDRHELVLAGIYWKVLMRWLDEARGHVPAERFFEIRYDDLIADPIGELRRIAAFADLRWHPRFERRIAATRITSDDTRWRKNLTADERRMLEDVLGEDLVRHGFEDAR